MTIEKLRQYGGANVDEGLERCMNNEALYLRLVGLVPNDENWDKIRDAAAEGDIGKIFEYAHVLTGAMGNLSLTKLYEKASEITELSRAKKDADYVGLVNELLGLRDELTEAMGE